MKQVYWRTKWECCVGGDLPANTRLESIAVPETNPIRYIRGVSVSNLTNPREKHPNLSTNNLPGLVQEQTPESDIGHPE